MQQNPVPVDVPVSHSARFLRGILAGMSIFTMLITTPKVLTIWVGHQSKSLTVRGFINYDFAAEYYPAFLSEVGAGIADGRIRYREDIVDGLENAPEAFIGMLERRNFGKLIVRVGARRRGRDTHEDSTIRSRAITKGSSCPFDHDIFIRRPTGHRGVGRNRERRVRNRPHGGA